MTPPPSTEKLRTLGYPTSPEGSVALPPCPPLSTTPAPLDAQFNVLFAMTPMHRVTAMYRAELTLSQLCKWAARYPEQIAVVNDEWVFIVAQLADVADAAPDKVRRAK